MAKTASLTGGLVVKKGSAAPTIQMPPVAADVSPVAPPSPVSASASPAAKKTVDYYKALTVKLDRERYESLKSAGVKLDKKSQEIFVEALDLWLKAQEI